jgi:hypothetical protein
MGRSICVLQYRLDERLGIRLSLATGSCKRWFPAIKSVNAESASGRAGLAAFVDHVILRVDNYSIAGKSRAV